MGAAELRVHRPGARKKPPQSGSMALRHWVAILLSLCLVGAIVAAFSSIGLLGTMFKSVHSLPDHGQRAAAALDRDTIWCKRLDFDNKNGRVFESNAPCDGEVLNASGEPVPVGTMHRLHAISKSFSRQ